MEKLAIFSIAEGSFTDWFLSLQIIRFSPKSQALSCKGSGQTRFYANPGCRHLRAKSPAFFFFLQKKKKKQKEEWQKISITQRISPEKLRGLAAPLANLPKA
jgi:hypothetical protein